MGGKGGAQLLTATCPRGTRRLTLGPETCLLRPIYTHHPSEVRSGNGIGWT